MVGERRIDFAELDASTRRVACGLQAAGLRPGDRIAWLGKNAVLYFTLLFGAARIGVVMAPVGWRLAAPERRYIVDDTEARLLFAGDGFADDARALAAALPRVQRVLSADEAWAWIDGTRTGRLHAQRRPTTRSCSSTPRAPPAIPRAWSCATATCSACAAPARWPGCPGPFWDDDEVVMVAMPCAHIGGTGLGFMALAGGVCGCVMAEFTPDGVFDAIEQRA